MTDKEALEYLGPLVKHPTLTGTYCAALKVAISALRERIERSICSEKSNSLDIRGGQIMDYADKLDLMDDDCDIQGFPLDDGKGTNVTTNADYIRSMSDEALAELLAEQTYFLEDGVDEVWGSPNGDNLPMREDSIKSYFNWLKQPYKEDNI